MPNKIEADPLPDIETIVAFASAVTLPRRSHGVALKPDSAEPFKRGFDAILRPGLQWAAQPFSLRRLQWALRRDDDSLRQHPPGHLSQHPFSRPAVDLSLRRLSQGKLDESVVEERLAQFGRGPHRDAVIEAQGPRNFSKPRVAVLQIAQEVREWRW